MKYFVDFFGGPRAFLSGIVLFAYANQAYAYVDPGSGMLLIQGLLALIGGVIAFLCNPLESIKSLINRILKKDKSKD